jgi:hypothetical protein
MAYKIHTPHDVYFQTMMEIVEVAESFFKSRLPAKAIEAIDWCTLKIADSARRTSHKKATYTDITYVCTTKQGGISVYLHVEQERNIDPTIIERILQYNLGLIIKHRKQNQGQLPIIANFIQLVGREKTLAFRRTL